jgi:hypothetical protein
MGTVFDEPDPECPGIRIAIMIRIEKTLSVSLA